MRVASCVAAALVGAYLTLSRRPGPIVPLAHVDAAVAGQVPRHTGEVLELLAPTPERPAATKPNGAAALQEAGGWALCALSKLLDVWLVQTSHRPDQRLLEGAAEDT